MSELIADVILALHDAQDAAAGMYDQLTEPSAADEAEKAIQVGVELGLIRKEMVAVSELSKEQAGEIVATIRHVIMRCTGELRQLHPYLMKTIEATLRAAE